MGPGAYGGRGFKGRARVSGERPIGAARCRQQYSNTTGRQPGVNWASRQPLPSTRPVESRAMTVRGHAHSST